MKQLPFKVKTATGDLFEIVFPLHRDTGDPIKVEQLVSVILRAVDAEMSVTGPTSNGDVLQAVAMTLAIRTAMIHAPLGTSILLTNELIRDALKAIGSAEISRAHSGRA